MPTMHQKQRGLFFYADAEASKISQTPPCQAGIVRSWRGYRRRLFSLSHLLGIVGNLLVCWSILARYAAIKSFLINILSHFQFPASEPCLLEISWPEQQSAVLDVDVPH